MVEFLLIQVGLKSKAGNHLQKFPSGDEGVGRGPAAQHSTVKYSTAPAHFAEGQQRDVHISDSARGVTKNASPARAGRRGSSPAHKGIGATDCGKIGDVPAELQQCRSCKDHE